MQELIFVQIFQPTDPATEQEALKTFQAMVKTIYAENVDTETEPINENIEGFAKDTCQECVDILREPEKSQAKYAIRVISAFMTTTRTFTSTSTINRLKDHVSQRQSPSMLYLRLYLI